MTYPIKLPTEAKAKWIAALRDPARRQVQEHLQTSEGQCCLGVACEVIGYGMRQTDYPPHPGEPHIFRTMRSTNVGEPEPADFDEEVSSALFQSRDKFALSPVMVLVDLNDAKRLNFNQIADWIEENL